VEAGDLAEDLVTLGLARPAVGEGWELWMDVEEHTANAFMAYLAVTLGAIQEVPMDPLTNREEAIAALLGWESGTGQIMKRTQVSRLGVLDELLPAPSAPISARDLAEFKRSHAAELARFRDAVNAELLRAAALPEHEAREAQADIGMRDLIRQRDELIAIMNRRQWPRIFLGSVAGLITATAAVAGPVVTGGDAKTAAFAAPGLIPAAYAVLKDVGRRPGAGDKPMAYAALAHARFAIAGTQ
jgi:hypothetical protein